MDGALKRYLLKEGAAVVGYAVVGEALSEDIAHLERAVSIGVDRRLNEDTVDLLGALRTKAERFLRVGGWKFLSIPADSDRVNDTFVSKLYGLFSHKVAATCAGLGWVGRNGLLISPEFGPRLSLATVLTDAPLKADEPIVQCLCEECFLCVEHCPSGAISGEDWSRENPFPGLIEHGKCMSYKENTKSLNGRPNCGLCINICPYGRKPVDEYTGNTV